MRLVTFNGWVGQHPQALRDNLAELAHDTGQPEAIAVQEAKRFGGSIPGYERVAWDEPSDHLEDRGCLLLIRRIGVEIHRRRFVHVGGPWWEGPNGERHPPRLYPGAGIETREGRAVLLNVHRAPGRKLNAGAWRAEHEDLAAWGKEREKPFAMLGDFNGRESDDGNLTIGDLARELDAQPHLLGIDGAITRGFKVTGLHKLPRKYGSDHHRPVVLDLEWK